MCKLFSDPGSTYSLYRRIIEYLDIEQWVFWIVKTVQNYIVQQYLALSPSKL